MKARFVIGIDPGVTTGFALYDRQERRLVAVESHSILSAMDEVRVRVHLGVEIRFEDARLRKWFGKKDREALQGAGSIKRDCQIWEDFCKAHLVEFKAVAPQHNTTKVDAALFSKLTGWVGRTNEHARDAAMLVYGA